MEAMSGESGVWPVATAFGPHTATPPSLNLRVERTKYILVSRISTIAFGRTNA